MDNLHLIQLNQYERPIITEEKNRDWIGIGEHNDYYQNLIDAFMDSTTNNAVINGIVDRIYGKGLDATDSHKKPEEYANMKSILKKKDLRRVCQDLKLLGEGAFQVTYQGNKIKSITHFPRETLRAEKCNEEGDIEAYYYSSDWKDVTRNTKLKRFPVFGSGAQNEIFIVRRYVTGYYYYSPADYQIAYAELEKEIADYLINDCKSGFSGTKILNFNNGVPDREKQLSIKNDVMNKLTGSHGEKVIIAFNNDAESKTTIDDVPLNDAPAHYSYLSEECSKKIMVTHRVTSPILIGLNSANGFSSNADEIKNASLLFDNVVIKPYQELLIDALDEMFAVNDIALNLYFQTIEPLEFIEIDKDMDAEVIEEETGIDVEDQDFKEEDEYQQIEELISKSKLSKQELTDEDYEVILDGLQGEVMDEDWEEVAERDYLETNDEEDWANSLIKTDLASIDDRPSGFSILDKSYYKIRFKYTKGSNKPNKKGNKSRPFCEAMMARTANKIVYRIEDIDKASNYAFEKSAKLPMHNKQEYSLFKFKGGVYCKHKWVQVLYKMKTKEALEGKKGSKDLEDYKRVKEIPKSYRRSPAGSNKAKVAPINMPNNGHYPGVK
tara:strand:+ start:1229 stop:3055 length:1827 start_codon:yes stop_codon:yes gene_type:complete